MSYWYTIPKQEYMLYHHGILGQKWGIRRFQPYGKGEKVKSGKEVGQATKVQQRTNSSNIPARYDKNAKMKDRMKDLKSNYEEKTGQKVKMSNRKVKEAVKAYDAGRKAIEKQIRYLEKENRNRKDRDPDIDYNIKNLKEGLKDAGAVEDYGAKVRAGKRILRNTLIGCGAMNLSLFLLSMK